MRSFNKLLVTSLIGLAGLSPLTAQTTLTLTTQGVGLVQESRQIELQEGEQSVTLKGVAAQLIPSSVFITGDETGFELLEQTFEYHPRLEDYLLKRTLGKKITLIHQGREINGTLLSADPATLILRDNRGQYQLVPRGKELRVVMPAAGTWTTSGPRLHWRIRAEGAGKKPFGLAYLTRGLNWHADYVAVLSKKEDNLRISCRITLENSSGQDYEGARIKLLAGDINIEKIRGGRSFSRTIVNMEAASAVTEKNLFEFYLYDLNRPTSLPDGSKKEVPLFSEKMVTVTKRFRLYSDRSDRVAVLLTFENNARNGPGRPLPAGTVRFYKKDDTALVFIGENSIDHTPRDTETEFRLGNAFDISSNRRQRVERPEKNLQRRRVTYTLHNHKKEAVRLEIWESFPNRTEAEVLKSDIEVTAVADGLIKMVTQLSAGEKKEIHIDYQYKW